MTHFTPKSKQDLINLASNHLKIKGKSGFICPFCHSGTKKHGTPALSIYQGKDGKGRFTCFSCNKQGDFYDLYQGITGQPYSDSLKTNTNGNQFQAATSFRKSNGDTNGGDDSPLSHRQPYSGDTNGGDYPQDNKPYEPPTLSDILLFNRCLLSDDLALFQSDEKHHLTDYKNDSSTNALKAFNYLLNRGIDEDLIERFLIGLSFDFQKRPFIVFPLLDKSDNIKGIEMRYFTDNKPFKQGKPKGQKGFILWNEKAFNENKPILILEGIIDALTVYKIKELKAFNAISINSAIYANRFIEYINENKPKNRLFIFMDKDKQGDKATSEIKNAFPLMENAHDFINITPYKDINDFYMATLKKGY